ncbi:MAG: hypothetical protein GX947_10570 [Tissierellia bacterium]|nr:hypothetical protein [Tissierellia bacterium]
MTIKSYKCPNCGAPIEFKPALGKFRCDYCLSEYTEAEINDLYKNLNEVEKETPQENIEGHNHLASYTCNSCGATVVTDDTTTSTFCYYCHNPVIISDRLSGSFKPNKMIPFSIDKEKAKETFLNWATKNKFVPSEFYSSSQLEKITGIYLPYWWADCEVEIDYVGEAEKNKVWQQGDTEYTETNKYQIVRKGQIDINNIEELAFTKIDNNLLNGIAPYNENEALDFSMPYLSGFFAEQYDISEEEITPKIEEQVNRFTKSLINDTIAEFSSVNERTNKTNILSKKMNYTLLPAWILTYLYEGKTYVFAVNGQTGKSFGELPLSNKKVLSAASIIFVAITIALLLGGKLIW